MILDDFRLDGKVALVTGCSRGLGRGIAEALAEAGADIVGVGVSDMSGVQKSVEGLGKRFSGLAVDLATPNAVADILTGVQEGFGAVDILVNNAGIIARNDLLEFTGEDWDRVMDLNLKQLFFLSQAVMKRFFLTNTGGGKIINIASMLSYQGGIRVPSYAASKAGVRVLTMSMANEMAPHGIHVNAIAPGYMSTDNTEALRNDAKRNSEIVARIPAGRWGQPRDLGGAAVFLASPASDYVNGITLPVDGGWLAR